MSVFRNTRPGDNKDDIQPAPSRFGEGLSRAEGNGDLLQNVETVEPPRPNFPTFTADRDPRTTMAEPGNGATPADKCANVIAAGSKWNGTLNLDDSVRIEGNLTGEIIAKGTVHISEGARVEAKIRAGFVVISGSFKGEVRCDERLELMPKSRVEGEMVTKVLNVHEGAVVDGSIQMASEPQAEAQRRVREPASA
jgi:cytoskeletal protein CcmA (bactofilin family)